MTDSPDTAKKPPRAPANLGTAGRALWRSVTAEFDFGATELAVLVAACRQADDIVLLEASISTDGATVVGSQGQPRLNAALTEVRQARLALAKLLGALALPDLDDDRPLTAAQRRASKAGRSSARRRTEHRGRTVPTRPAGGI